MIQKIFAKEQKSVGAQSFAPLPNLSVSFFLQIGIYKDNMTL